MTRLIYIYWSLEVKEVFFNFKWPKSRNGPINTKQISPEAEQTIAMKHALRNTTAFLRGLAAGNLTDIASLLSGAYAEVASISSLLLGFEASLRLVGFTCWEVNEVIFWIKGPVKISRLEQRPRFKDDSSSTAEALKDGAAYGGTLLAKCLGNNHRQPGRFLC